MEKAHVVAVKFTEDEILATFELRKKDGSVKILTMEIDDLSGCIAGGLQVTYEETDEIVEALKLMSCGYVSVEIDADGSSEHDVYLHKAIVADGEIKMDVSGEYLKSYKRKDYAIKYANRLGWNNVVVR